MDPHQARVFHRGYTIELFDIEYDILITNEDIEFAAMTIDMMHKNLDLDTSSIVGKQAHALKIVHPEIGYRLFGMLNLDLENKNDLENTISLMSDITRLSTKLSWFILEQLDIEITNNNNNLHGFIVSKVFKDIYGFVQSVLEADEENEEQSPDSDIEDL